jgi:ADP-heptose:LPS heptosyltransferase
MSDRKKRILVFRIGQLGDTIIALPAMRAIRSHFPDAHLALLSDSHPGESYVLASDLLSGCGLFNEFLSYRIHANRISRLWSMAFLLAVIRAKGFDTLVYLAPTGRSKEQINRDRRFFRLAGIKRFIGMKKFATLPGKIPGRLMVRVKSEADLLLARLEADHIPVLAPGEARAEFRLGTAEETEVACWLNQLPSDDGHPWIGVGPGSKMPAKRWPEERFRQVVKKLVEESDVWPVIFGGAEDAKLGERLISAWGRGFNAAGALSLRGSAAALQRCLFLLTNDTGTMHLGAAVGVQCVALFSSREAPGLWNPLGKNHVLFRSDIECEGCGLVECLEYHNECLNRISVADVLKACRAILSLRDNSARTVGMC